MKRIRSPEKVQVRAKELRKDMTQTEKILWQSIRNRKLQGLKFRRQHPIGPFIADFYCASHRLVIEIDGSIHEMQKDIDHLRTHEFEKYGYRVIRFSNHDVIENLEGVLEEIASQCNQIEMEI